MADDDLAAELDRIAAETRTFGASGEDTARLLAALRAVLREAERLDSGRGDYGHLVNRHETAALFREAITREITRSASQCAAARGERRWIT